MDHKHKILKIIKASHSNGVHVHHIKMDCPVQPFKIVVTSENLIEGEVFDPHFSNECVFARFPPTEAGWSSAISFYVIR